MTASATTHGDDSITDGSELIEHKLGNLREVDFDFSRILRGAERPDLALEFVQWTLSEDAQRHMLAWHDTGYPVPYWYGLGLMKYHDNIGHSGYIPGYQCTMMYNPAADRTIMGDLYRVPNGEPIDLEGETHAPRPVAAIAVVALVG